MIFKFFSYDGLLLICYIGLANNLFRSSISLYVSEIEIEIALCTKCKLLNYTELVVVLNLAVSHSSSVSVLSSHILVLSSLLHCGVTSTFPGIWEVQRTNQEISFYIIH